MRDLPEAFLRDSSRFPRIRRRDIEAVDPSAQGGRGWIWVPCHHRSGDGARAERWQGLDRPAIESERRSAWSPMLTGARCALESLIRVHERRFRTASRRRWRPRALREIGEHTQSTRVSWRRDRGIFQHRQGGRAFGRAAVAGFSERRHMQLSSSYISSVSRRIRRPTLTNGRVSGPCPQHLRRRRSGYPHAKEIGDATVERDARATRRRAAFRAELQVPRREVAGRDRRLAGGGHRLRKPRDGASPRVRRRGNLIGKKSFAIAHRRSCDDDRAPSSGSSPATSGASVRDGCSVTAQRWMFKDQARQSRSMTRQRWSRSLATRRCPWPRRRRTKRRRHCDSPKNGTASSSSYRFPITLFDAESFRILAANEAAIRLYGYTRDEFLAKEVTT